MDGQWVTATADPQGNNSIVADSITYNYRLEDISIAGQNKALEAILR